MAILRMRQADGTWVEIPALIGPRGEKGESGVYVGSNTPPEGYDIWLNPNGEPTSTEDWEFDLESGATETKTVVVVGSDDSSQSGKLGILRFKQADGTWSEIPALVGKSAYAYAKDGGYTGTEAEFAAGFNAVPDIADKIDNYLDAIKGEAPPIACDASGSLITLEDASNRRLLGLKLYGKTTQDGTPTPEAPVELVSAGASGAINTTVCGKNLVDVFNDKLNLGRSGADYSGSSYEHRDYINKVADDGTVTVDISGTVTYGLGFTKKLLKGQTVTISFNVLSVGTSGNGLTLNIYDTENYSSYKRRTVTKETGVVSTTFTADADSTYQFGWYVGSGTMPCGAQFNKLQLEFGNLATSAIEYEPYKTAQTITANTPNGLSSIGDVMDEIDFARGKYVQRVGRIDSYAGEEIPGAYMSTTGELSEGAAVLYVLAEPIETDLSAEELASYSALHTNELNTTVYNDGGAWMELQYVTDTKSYIHNVVSDKPVSTGSPHTVVTNGALNAMLLLAEDYFKWAYNNSGSSPLVYGGAEEDNSLWYRDMAPVLTDDGVEQYTINCSGFVNVLLQAVPFGKSRYALGADAENYHEAWAYRFDDTARHGDMRETHTLYGKPVEGNNVGGVFTYDLYRYAEEHGFAYEVADDLSNVRPGDVLFVSDPAYPERYKGIVHCALCLCVDRTRRIATLLHSTTATRKIPETGEELPVGICFANFAMTARDYKYGARFPLGDASKAELVSCNTEMVNKTVSLDNVDRGIYTFVVKGKFSSNPRLYFTYAGSTKSDYLTMLSVDDNTCVLTRYLPEATTALSVKPGSDGSLFDVESVAVYHGYAYPHGHDDQIGMRMRLQKIERAISELTEE